jgi:uncharacterized protein YodC (DUF2158 family)
MSEDIAIKVWDVVCLKSGGTLMTVTSMDGDAATCEWSVRGVAKSHVYPVKALKKSDEKPQKITIDFGRNLPGAATK